MIEEVVGLLGASAQGVPAWVAGSAAITAAAGAFIAHWRKANTEERVAEHEMDIKKETALVRQVRDFTIVHATLDSPGSWGYVTNRFDAMASA